MLSESEQTILEGWEEVYKKSQLTLWILLALKVAPKHMSEVKVFILDLTNRTIEVDDKSMYRALRRFEDIGLIEYNLKDNLSGPKQKVYRLSMSGVNVLKTFIDRNINGIFLREDIRRLLNED
jgi:PadR family transcriptional regulator PadR